MKTLHELAIEYAKSIYQEEYDDPTFAPDVFQTKNDFAAGYKAAFEWISVEDELPNEVGDYLVKKIDGSITIMSYHPRFDSGKRIFQWFGFGMWIDQHKKVTHWRPINND